MWRRREGARTSRGARMRILALAAACMLTGSSGWVHTARAGSPELEQSGAWCASRCGDPVLGWSRTAYAVIVADSGYQNPLAASRALAMMHIAMHDAANAAVPRFATYAIRVRDGRADAAVAAVVAAHRILTGLYPAQKPLIDAELSRTLIDAGTGVGVARGTWLGEAVARDVLAERANDGSARKTEEGGPAGAYRHVPGTEFMADPHWRAVRPFALKSPSQYRVASPPALDSAEYEAAFNEVKALGGKRQEARTRDQSDYAAFWNEPSDISWNRVARTAAGERNLDLWSSARLFALLNIAMADAYIGSWDSKIHRSFWRPATAIRVAHEDGNAKTDADPAWESSLPTPPIQDHRLARSTLGAAAAAVLTEVIGDSAGFTLTSSSALVGNPVRRFRNFRDAARENAESGIMAGLNFRFAVEAELKLGEQIGRYALDNHLRPPRVEQESGRHALLHSRAAELSLPERSGRPRSTCARSARGFTSRPQATPRRGRVSEGRADRSPALPPTKDAAFHSPAQ
jgi:hypothetical protein